MLMKKQTAMIIITFIVLKYFILLFELKNKLNLSYNFIIFYLIFVLYFFNYQKV